MSAPRGVLLLVGGQREVDLIRTLDAPGTGLTVTRRCADVAELVAAACAGAGQVAVVAATHPGVDLTLLARLAAQDVRTVLLGAGADLDRWRSAHAAVPDDAPAARVMAAVVAALAAPARTARPEPGGAPETTQAMGAAEATGAGRPGATGRGDARRDASGDARWDAPNPWLTVAAPDGDAGVLPPWHPAAPGGPRDPSSRTPATPDPGGPEATGLRGGRDATGADRPGAPATPPGPATAPARDPGPAGREAAGGSAPPARESAGGSAAPAPPASPQDVPAAPAAPEGRLVVVWGAPGAPGRTTVAITLAAELAALATPGRAARRRGQRSRPRATAPTAPRIAAPHGPAVLLIDADTEAPSVAQALAVLDDASAVAALARRAAHGRLTPAALRRLSPLLRPGLHVATGLSRADRWRELPAAAMDEVWAVARRAAGVTVVDVGAGAEEPPPGLDGWGAPARHGVTLSALAAADTVLVVGAADPVGIRRLVLALTELRERDLAPRAEVIPVVTRVRASVAGADAGRSVLGVLARYADVAGAVLVPDDRPAADRCLLEGRTLAECAPASAARAPIAALAAALLPEPVGVRR